jgi:hypothetical protein
MFTADDARNEDQSELDNRIRQAVKDREGGPNGAYLRVYIDDPWIDTIKDELERRGFKRVQVPDIILKGDVYFEW